MRAPFPTLLWSIVKTPEGISGVKTADRPMMGRSISEGKLLSGHASSRTRWARTRDRQIG